MIVRSESIVELTKALVNAQAEFPAIARDSDNPFYGSKYSDLATVIETVKPILKNYGLAVIQPPSSADVDGSVTIETILLHTSGEFISGSLTLKPKDNTPQAVGSAITYNRRYAYMAMLGIASKNEDDDGQEGTHPNASLVQKNGPSRDSGEKKDKDPQIITAVFKTGKNAGRKYQYDVANRKFVKFLD